MAPYDVSTGTPYRAVNASARSGSSGAVPDTTERMLVEHVVVDVGVEHHAQRGGHEADGLGPVLAHRVDPTVDGEALEQGDAAAVEHRLHDAEHAAHVDQRRVDDDDARPEADVGVRVPVS